MHEFDSGFSVREPMWHRLGNVSDRYPENWDEAREWAGLKWEPVEGPLLVPSAEGRYELIDHDPTREPAHPDLVPSEYGRATAGRAEVATSHKGIFRSDDGRMLSVVGKDFEVVTHAQMGEIVEALLDQPGVRYETAGSLRGGKRVWALARLDEPAQVPGDPSKILPFLALLNAHGDNAALRAIYTMVRIVCMNTWNAADGEAERQGTAFTFRHSSGVSERIEDARAALAELRVAQQEWLEMGTGLMGLPVSPDQRERFVVEFQPMPPESLVSDRVVANVRQARQVVRDILDGPTCEGINDTAWGLVQAAVEYLDHYRRYQSSETYVRRTLLRPERLKRRALSLAQEVAG